MLIVAEIRRYPWSTRAPYHQSSHSRTQVYHERFLCPQVIKNEDRIYDWFLELGEKVRVKW